MNFINYLMHFMTNKHTFKTMNLHIIYHSVIVLNLCKQLIIIGGIFPRLALINCIGSKDRAHIITGMDIEIKPRSHKRRKQQDHIERHCF